MSPAADQLLATKADLAEFEKRIVKWAIGIAIGSVGVLFTLIHVFLV